MILLWGDSMAICITHNQSYNENLSGFCPYCGPPEFETKTTTDIKIYPPKQAELNDKTNPLP